jgi:hypothetical protein
LQGWTGLASRRGGDCRVASKCEPWNGPRPSGQPGVVQTPDIFSGRSIWLTLMVYFYLKNGSDLGRIWISTDHSVTIILNLNYEKIESIK